MSDNFNPYHKWLGIPVERQPADHYRLLGLELSECDPDVITHAAEQRMMLLRTLQTGDRANLSQQLLNEISEARGCLLDAEKKLAYDKLLLITRQEISSFPSPPPITHSNESQKPPVWFPKQAESVTSENLDRTNIEIEFSEKNQDLDAFHPHSSEETTTDEKVLPLPFNTTYPGPPPLASIPEPPAQTPASNPKHSFPTPPPLPPEKKASIPLTNSEGDLPSWLSGGTTESNDSELVKNRLNHQSEDNNLATVYNSFGGLAENVNESSQEDFFSPSRTDEISRPEKLLRTSNRKKENRIRLIGHIAAPIIGLILGWVILQFLLTK